MDLIPINFVKKTNVLKIGPVIELKNLSVHDLMRFND